MMIGDKIRYQRKLNNIRQETLGDLIGVSTKTVQRWENGERSPRLEEMTKLAEVLNVPVTYFTEDSSVPVLMKNEQSERKQNIAVITLENGRKVEAPATPEGYAFLERLFAMSLSGQPSAVAMA